MNKADIIEKLLILRYLDDQRFAVNFTGTRMEINLEGSYRIKHGLKERGVDSAIVEKIFTSLEEENSFYGVIEKAVEKQIRIKGVPSSQKDVDRIMAYLTRKGFKTDMILKVTRELRENTGYDESM